MYLIFKNDEINIKFSLVTVITQSDVVYVILL